MSALRVLLAEDDPLARETIVEMLELEGFVMIPAVDGAEALEIASRQMIDVLVTDIQMPRLMGDALVRRLRAVRPDLPIVVITGFASESAFRAIKSVDGVPPEIIPKPFDMGYLAQAIRDATRGNAHCLAECD